MLRNHYDLYIYLLVHFSWNILVKFKFLNKKKLKMHNSEHFYYFLFYLFANVQYSIKILDILDILDILLKLQNDKIIIGSIKFEN